MENTPFQNLSPEIRNMIWTLVVVQPSPIDLNLHLKEALDHQARQGFMLPQVCRQMRNESLLMFYGLNDFVLGLHDGKCVYRSAHSVSPTYGDKCCGSDTVFSDRRIKESVYALNEIGPGTVRLMRTLTVCANSAKVGNNGTDALEFTKVRTNLRAGTDAVAFMFEYRSAKRGYMAFSNLARMPDLCVLFDPVLRWFQNSGLRVEEKNQSYWLTKLQDRFDRHNIRWEHISLAIGHRIALRKLYAEEASHEGNEG